MRKWIAITLACMTVAASAATRYASNRIMAADRGAKTSATLNTLISALGSRQEHIVINAGQWSITNNVTVPTNITIEIERGSSLSIDTGVVWTQNGGFLAGPYRVFYGAGTAAGTGSFLYRWDEWGTNTFNIGPGELPQNSTFTNWLETFYQENGGPILTTTNWTDNGGITLTTNDLDLGGGNIVTTNLFLTYPVTNISRAAVISAVPDIVTNETLGYITGLLPQYVATNQVSVSPGEGYCNGVYFRETDTITNTLTDMQAATTGFVYLAIDYSASTFPDGLVYYDTTNEPTELPAQGSGWYVTTSQQDRVFCPLNYYATGLPQGSVNGWNIMENGRNIRMDAILAITLLDNATPSAGGAYLATGASNYMPVNATESFCSFRGEDNDNMGIAAGPSTNGPPSWRYNVDMGAQNLLRTYQWTRIDPDVRETYFFGEPNDASAMDCVLYGYGFRR